MPLQNIVTAIGQRLKSQFDLDKKDRQPMEEEWLQDQRDYQGQYDPTTLKNIRSRPGSSEAFIRITRTKVKTLDARIGDLIQGTGVKNWSIEATPVPEMEESTGDELKDREIAAGKAEKMTNEVDDQLVEASYVQHQQNVYHSGHKLGTGILKGPLVQTVVNQRWSMEGDKPVIIRTEKQRPFIEFCPLWDYYPEMAARDLYSTERDQHRRLMTKKDLYSLAARKGFSGKAIKDHISSNPNGDATWTYWEQELMQIGRFDASTVRPDLKRYEVVEFWGIVELKELREVGAEVPEELEDGIFEANVWFFAQSGIVIKAAINPFEKGTRPFSFYTPEPEDERLFGMSLPFIMRDPMRLLNGAVRMWVDNAAFSAGPQVEIDVDRLVGEDDIDLLRPFRIWLTKSEAYNANTPAIRFESFPNQGQQLMAMINVMKSLTDEATAIPSYQHGERSPGAGRTAAGLNMLMGAAALMLKGQLGAWDAFQGEFLGKMFDWNMQFNPRHDIKGDQRVRIVGSHSLALKAERATQLEGFAMSTANEFDMPFMKRRPLLVARAEAQELEPTKFVKSEDEMLTEMKEMKAQQDAEDQAEAEEAERATLAQGIEGDLNSQGASA